MDIKLSVAARHAESAKRYQALERRAAAARAIDVAARNAELAKRLGIWEFTTSQAGSTEEVTPEMIAGARRFGDNFLQLRKNWYERLDSQEKSKVDPYWVSYKDRVSVLPGKAPFSIQTCFRQLAEKHHLFFQARDGLIVPNDGGILNALCKAAFAADSQWKYCGLPLESAPAVLVRGYGTEAQFALASERHLIEEYVKTIVLLSGQKTRVSEARPCDECGRDKKSLWHFSRSNRGPVYLCEKCKQIVYGRSPLSIRSGLPARAAVSGGAFEMNRRGH